MNLIISIEYRYMKVTPEGELKTPPLSIMQNRKNYPQEYQARII